MADIVGLLQTEKDAFTRSERALTEIVLADVDRVLKMSIVDLALQADVSPPTVTRFCRRLGCDSYADFKVRLAQSRFVGQRYFAPTAGPTSVPEIAQGVVNGIQSIIYETFDNLDFQAVERAAESVVKSNFVLAFGSGGASSMMAGEVEARLFRLGLKVASTDDHQLQLMRVAAAPAGTVIVAFSLSGNNAQLAKTLTVAGEYGLTRIVATRSGSMVSRQCDILLPVNWHENSDILRPTPGRYAFLATVDVLAQTVATRLGPQAIASMRRIKHQLVVNRDGDDAQPLGD
ncbi:MurR/RpiR family transcriptional regulator [Devosia rhizoryzae]|uniref:MurR/RpiR family transcriptional regulator n=1 Tax=Devosia rhizoryzae TaxID=2774137 RepID=A0ABX7C3M9_9HYPH|nr:MurR/RpiR family transcriptional regulator [Devosia rhizoryzae]QQR38691.1 MurR/RpiR family transcriptional regulator [Devosia rhizoryzae]